MKRYVLKSYPLDGISNLEMTETLDSEALVEKTIEIYAKSLRVVTGFEAKIEKTELAPNVTMYYVYNSALPTSKFLFFVTEQDTEILL